MKDLPRLESEVEEVSLTERLEVATCEVNSLFADISETMDRYGMSKNMTMDRTHKMLSLITQLKYMVIAARLEFLDPRKYMQVATNDRESMTKMLAVMNFVQKSLSEMDMKFELVTVMENNLRLRRVMLQMCLVE